MHKRVVMSDEDAAAEALRLGGELRAVRLTAGHTTRAVAAAAGVNLGTLWRLETGRNTASMYKFALLVRALRHRIELDDGTERPRVPLPAWLLWAPGWVQPGAGEVQARWALRSEHLRLGSELVWLRRHLLELTEEAVCDLLGMSHHTLRAVEIGPGWPYLTSVVRVAALCGRRLELVPEGVDPRLPPWLPVADLDGGAP